MLSLNTVSQDNSLISYRALGATILAQNGDFAQANTSNTFVSQAARFAFFYLEQGITATGLRMLCRVVGVYTPNNFNGVALYSFVGGVITRIAISADIPTLWSGTAAGSIISAPFTAPINLLPGIYFVGLLYNTSAQTTAPQIDYFTTFATNKSLALFTGNVALTYTLAAQTTLPASATVASLTAVSSWPWLALY
jgi:hypothetical protein